MSKSSGEFFTLSFIQNKGYDPLVYRMFCLQSHYRNPLEFSYAALDNTVVAYNKLKKRILKLDREGVIDEYAVKMYTENFISVVGNDLNIVLGITMIYNILEDDKINDATKLSVISSFDEVLSLDIDKYEEPIKKVDSEMEDYIAAKIEERYTAKTNKDYALVDMIRKELDDKGITIIDTKEGTYWEIKK